MFNIEKFKNFMLMHKDLPHTSRYHAEDYFQHVMCMVDYITTTHFYNRPLMIATCLHDVGKPETHRYREGKGNTFYGHEEKSEELVKEFLSEDDIDYKEVCFLVRNHMLPFTCKGPNPWAEEAKKQIAEFACSLPSMWLSDLFYLNALDQIQHPEAKFEDLVKVFDKIKV